MSREYLLANLRRMWDYGDLDLPVEQETLQAAIELIEELPPEGDARTADELLAQFQQECEACVTLGPGQMRERHKSRAITRNALRAMLLSSDSAASKEVEKPEERCPHGAAVGESCDPCWRAKKQLPLACFGLISLGVFCTQPKGHAGPCWSSDVG